MKHELTRVCKNHKHLQLLMEQVLDVRYTDLEQEFSLCQELLHRSEAEDFPYGRAFALIYLGDYYIARNNGHTAGEYLAQARPLCENQKYIALSMNLNIFYGIYYDMMLDQFMSLTCTLEALDFAIQLNDQFRESVILNNIANMFETFGDMEAASAYYHKGFDCLGETDVSTKNTSHYALIVANLIHLACHTDQIEQAKSLLKEFDCIDLSVSDQLGQYLVSCCHLAAAHQDFSAVREYIDRVIEMLTEKELWGYQFFEIVLHMAAFSLEFDDKEYSHKTLAALENLCGENEPGNQLRAQKLRVRYCERFGTEQEQSAAYKRYYQLTEIIDVTNNKTMSAGLHAKISLRQVAKKQVEILKIAEQLETEAQRDELTQLHNRRAFAHLSQRIAEDLAVSSLGLVMIDVDYFKQYNDTYGHSDGDDVLRTVAEYMTQAAAENPCIYNFRYGGDEFVCMYENCTVEELEHYVTTLTELMRCRSIPHRHSLCGDSVSLSIGFHLISRTNDAPLDIAALLTQADKALYRSKKRGRNGYCRFADEW